MARCINDLTKYNCPPILGTITGRLDWLQHRWVPSRLVPMPTWSVEQSLAFIEEQAYSPEEMAGIAKRAILNKG